MEKFTVHTGTAVPLRRSNVDTDQIIPAVYLKRVTRSGFEDGLFRSWRDADPGFVLNDPRYSGASILIAGPEFGTGSSREHAVWALRDWGFAAVLAPGHGDGAPCGRSGWNSGGPACAARVPPSKGWRPAGESPVRASRQRSPVVKSPVTVERRSRREVEQSCRP